MVNGYMCLCTDGYSGGFCEKGLVIQHVFSLKHGITRILLIYVYFMALLSSLAHTLCSFLSPMSTPVFLESASIPLLMLSGQQGSYRVLF